MRVHPGQTLILAGEMLPRRAVGGANTSNTAAGRNASNVGSAQRVTIISARVDAVVTDAEYTPRTGVPDTDIVASDATDVGEVNTAAALPASSSKTLSVMTSRSYSSYASTNRASSFGGASAYARTQDLAERHPIIDTYA